MTTHNIRMAIFIAILAFGSVVHASQLKTAMAFFGNAATAANAYHQVGMVVGVIAPHNVTKRWTWKNPFGVPIYVHKTLISLFSYPVHATYGSLFRASDDEWLDYWYGDYQERSASFAGGDSMLIAANDGLGLELNDEDGTTATDVMIWYSTTP